MTLQILNDIYSLPVKEFLKYLDNYDVDIQEFSDNVLDVLDDGIKESKLCHIFTIEELAHAAKVISTFNKLPYPGSYKKALQDVDKTVLTPELFAEYYQANPAKAVTILQAAQELTRLIKCYFDTVTAILKA